MRISTYGLAILSLCLVTVVGCSGGGGGTGRTVVPLNTSTALGFLYCEDEGIYPNTCTLDNPNNPFKDSAFEDIDSYFEVAADLPSALSAFYLWATGLARTSNPDFQFLVAQSLHALYTEGGDPLAKEQAIKAYRQSLDEFYDATFYFAADYLTGEPLVGLSVKNLIAENLANSFEQGFTPLVEPFDENLGQAQALVGEWGYSIRVVVAPDLSTPDIPDDTITQYIMER
jgi:hypothetical protein